MSRSDYKNDGYEDDAHLVTFQAGPSLQNHSPSMVPMNIRQSDSKSHMIIQVPADRMRKIRDAEGTVSVDRETQHFCETTTMHGPKRVYKGKRWATLFWAVMVTFSLSLLVTQVVILVSQYLSKPIISDVTFLINEEGMDFPLVTICNLNPIRKSYVESMNKSGEVSPEMIKYLMYYSYEMQQLIGGTDRSSLHAGNDLLKIYQSKHPNFTPDGFFMDAGFECSEIFKLCSFQGKLIDCCSLTTPLLTPLGKCYTLDMSKSPDNTLHKQVEPGITAGLQITLDVHLEEQFNGENGSMPPLFTNSFVDGFRYFVHPPNTIPHLASDEFTVSPNTVAYSAISSDRFLLLSADEWGNCTTDYPDGIHTQLPYTSGNCLALCKAKFFNDSCGCSPSIYNLQNGYPECNPLTTLTCLDKFLQVNGSFDLSIPLCNKCSEQCNSLVYRAYNSYGSRFSNGALQWLSTKNINWTMQHMRENFQMINIYFRDMSHTEYSQVQDASITQLLSDIGGNMGMFLGMSVITITEISLFFSKVIWIGISRKRRQYMYSKKIQEKTHEKDVDETIQKVKVIESSANLRNRNGSAEKDENIEFRFDIRDLARNLDNGPAYIRTEVSRSRGNTEKY